MSKVYTKLEDACAAEGERIYTLEREDGKGSLYCAAKSPKEASETFCEYIGGSPVRLVSQREQNEVMRRALANSSKV